MRTYPMSELHRCSVRGCLGTTTRIIQRTFGEETSVLYGYCQFHAVISDTFFSVSEHRKILTKMVVK